MNKQCGHMPTWASISAVVFILNRCPPHPHILFQQTYNMAQQQSNCWHPSTSIMYELGRSDPYDKLQIYTPTSMVEKFCIYYTLPFENLLAGGLVFSETTSQVILLWFQCKSKAS